MSDVTSPAHAALAGEQSSSKPLSMQQQLQKDAFLVFRALCKLSIRSTESAPGSEITTIRGKVGSEGGAVAVVLRASALGAESRFYQCMCLG